MQSVAIVGSGPAGCYTAQFIRKALPSAEVVVFDRLPVPYGLIRYGVAPDHVGTKAVSAQFDRLFERSGVHFMGNVDIGTTVPLSALHEAFDAVVVATGLYGDISLAIDGADLPEVIGAGRFTRFVNLHPDEVDDIPALGDRVVVVGNGNVSIDIVRMLAKATSDFDGSDLSDDVFSSVASRVKTIDVIGRSPVNRAKFDPVMVRELSRIDDVAYEVLDHLPSELAEEGAEHPGAEARQEAIAELSAAHPSDARVTVRFHFGAVPISIGGDGHVDSIRIALENGGDLRLAATAVITAIGFERRSQDLDAGEEASGLFRAGWARRGPNGTIPENRIDGRETGAAVVEWLTAQPQSVKPGLAGLGASLAGHAVDFAGWKKIERYELDSAPSGRVRQKVKQRELLLQLARQDSPFEHTPEHIPIRVPVSNLKERNTP